MMSEREKQWLEFSERVATHLREYTVPQYGDVGEDLITNYTTEQCVEQVVKYARRYGSQSREGQQELDFVKIAHYVQCAWEKRNNTENEDDDVYVLTDLDGVDDSENCEYIAESTYRGKIIKIYKKRVAL